MHIPVTPTVIKMRKTLGGGIIIDDAPEKAKMVNWLFEQAEYRPTDILRFDGHHVIFTALNGQWRYTIDREGVHHMVLGYMVMTLDDMKPNPTWTGDVLPESSS